MQEKSLIKKNILKFLDSKGISKYEFYKRTGITRGILDQNNGMSEENTTRFLAVYGTEISAERLFQSSGDINELKKNNSSPPYKIKPSSNDVINEESELILALKETINTQHKYIARLEEENLKLKTVIEKMEPAEDGQKRKVV